MKEFKEFTSKTYFFEKEQCKKIYHRKREYFPFCATLNISIAPISDEAGTCFLWCFEINGKTVFGRSIEELAIFLENFKRIYLYRKRSGETMKMLIYLQNAQDLFYFIYRNSLFKFEEDRVIYFNRANEVFKFWFDEIFEVRSLKMITEYNINTYAEILEKTFQIDSFIENRLYTSTSSLPETVFEYYEEKTNIIYEYIDKFYFSDYVGRKGRSVSDIPTTSTSDVKRIIRAAHGDKAEYKTNREFMMFCCGYDKNFKKIKLYEGISKSGITKYNKAYSEKDISDVESYDYDSFFPFLMLTKKFPCNIVDISYMCEDQESCEELFRDLYNKKKTSAFFLEVTFKNINSIDHKTAFLSAKNRHFLSGKNVKKDSQGSLKAADEITYRMTGIDFLNVLKYYEVEEVSFERCFVADLAPLPIWYKKAIVTLYVEKEKLKEHSHESNHATEMYRQAKKRLNRLYGILIEAPDRKYKYIAENGKVTETNDYTNEADHAHYSYQWGIYVTAYARHIILQWIDFLGENFIYSDIDCLKFFKNPEVLEFLKNNNEFTRNFVKKLAYQNNLDFEGYFNIGQLKSEGTSKLLKVLDLKRYAEIKEDGIFKCTVSGLTEEDKKRYFKDCNTEKEKFDKFNNKSIFSCFSPNCIAVKNLNPFTLYVNDYNGDLQEVTESGSIVYIARDFDFDFRKKSMSLKEGVTAETIEKIRRSKGAKKDILNKMKKIENLRKEKKK